MTGLFNDFQDDDDEVIDYPEHEKGEKEQNKPLNYPRKDFSEEKKDGKEKNKKP